MNAIDNRRYVPNPRRHPPIRSKSSPHDPVNIASYALLTLMMAQVCGLQPGEFVHTLGDAHIYLNHIEQVRLQLSREPRALPQMHINPAVKDIFGFRYEDFELTGYDPHPHIKGAISV